MSAPQRVVVTTVFGDVLGGAERVLWWWLRDTDRERVAPALVLHRDGDLAGRASALDIPVAIVPTGRFREPHRAIGAVRRIARLLRDHRPGAVLHWLHRAQLYGGPAAALAGLADRSIWWQHGLDSGVGRLDRAATVLPARAIGAASEHVAEMQRAIRPHRPVFTVPMGIEPPRQVSAAELATLRADLDLPVDGPPVIGIVGRLQPWKNQHRFLDALAELRLGGRDVRGLVVGGAAHGIDSGYERELHARAAASGLEDTVRFTGWVPDASAHTRLMDVLVNASDAEPFGLVLVEGLAAGVPVVAVGAGGPLEILQADRSGVFARSSTPADLAAAIARVLTDPELRGRLTEGGPARYRERFTAARVVADIDDALLTIASGGLPQSARTARS